MLKMTTKDNKFVIFDRGRILKFDKSYDAWAYVFLAREIREKVDMGPRSLYPVRSLNPVPERRRTKEKRLSIDFPEVMSHVASRASGACPTTLCDTKVDGGGKRVVFK